ncbi:MAG: PilW family protein [Azonexus sp.]|nr:PilW family protein [Azonexus sp.]
MLLTPNIMNNSNLIRPRYQLGFTLIELMIAMVLNLILIGGIFVLYRGSGETSRAQSAVSSVQENLRFAFEYLSFDVRMAGYNGCANVREAKPQVVASPVPAGYGSTAPATSSMTVRGYGNGSGWTNPSSIVRVSGTDVITIFRSAPDKGVRLSCDSPDPTQSQLFADSLPFKIDDGQLLMITDCSRSDVFRSTSAVNVSSGKVNIVHASNKNTQPAGSACAPGSGKLPNECKTGSYTCKDGARISVMESWTYFVGTNPRGRPSLYRVSDSGPAVVVEELVENVLDLQLRYGLDTDGNAPFVAVSYSDAPADWSQVVSVEAVITARSEQEYRLNSANSSGSPVTYEQSQTFLIGLRNLVQ